MKASKEIYSEYFKEYTLAPEKLTQLHNTLLSMLIDFDEICKKYKINYMLSGGSVLGAVRHKGFIPWDDDIDIMITRENYEKFLKVAEREIGDKYILVEPLTKNYFFKMPKLYLKNSIYSELAVGGTPDYHMIFIDLFIIEYVPDSYFLRKIKGFFYDFAYKASSVCIDYKYPSPPIIKKAKTEETIKHYYEKRRKWGGFFSAIGGMDYYLRIDEKIAKSTHKSNYMGIPSGISYNREVFNKIVYLQQIDAEFEGHLFPIPRDYHLYLSNLYGDDYMSVPPKEKRQMHLAYELQFPE